MARGDFAGLAGLFGRMAEMAGGDAEMAAEAVAEGGQAGIATLLRHLLHRQAAPFQQQPAMLHALFQLVLAGTHAQLAAE
mgnify:CR=1 FL=1